MGLKGSLKAWILARLAPNCARSGGFTASRAVRIVDGLNGLYHARGPRFNNTFTGDEAFQLFIAPMRHAMNGGVESVYAMVCDDQAGVPWQKHMEQTERRAAKATPAAERQLNEQHPDFERYPDSCTFEAAGIRRPGAEAETMLLDEVLKNSRLRKKLLRFFAECMAAGGVSVPDDKMVRFFFDSAGEWTFMSDAVHRGIINEHTGFGEYDTTAMRLACEYRDRPIIFQTSDTDIIPLVTALLSSRTFACDVVWVTGGGTYVDCKLMVDQMLRATGLDARTFIVGCILCGTDFVKKKWFATQFNDGAIMAALRHPTCASRFRQLENESHEQRAPLESVVRWLHTARLNDTVRQVRSARQRQKLSEKKRTAAAVTAVAVKDEPGASRKRKQPDDAVKSETPPPPSKKQKRKTEVVDGTSAASVAAATTCADEFDLIVRHMVHVTEPLSIAACAESLGKKHVLPTDADYTEACPRVHFNLWYWMYSWTLDASVSYEAWRRREEAAERSAASVHV